MFKSGAQRIVTALTTLTTAQPPTSPLRPVRRRPQIALTHEQLAALACTSRETCTAVLRAYADHGLLRPGRDRSPASTPNDSRTPRADVTEP